MRGKTTTQLVCVSHQLKESFVLSLKLERLVKVVDGVHIKRIFNRVYTNHFPEDWITPQSDGLQTVSMIVGVEEESRLMSIQDNRQH